MAYNDLADFISYIEDDIYDYSVVNIPRRYVRDFNNPLDFYSAGEFKKRFRVTKETFSNVLMPLVFGENDVGVNNRGLPIPPLMQLVLALRFYATGNYQMIDGDLVNFSQPTASRIVRRVSTGLKTQLAQFVHFPKTHGEIEIYNRQFYRQAKVPGIVGCIDCTHIPIKSPGGERSEHYRNRKGWFSLNVQVVCGPNLEILDIVARWPGSAHDSRIFGSSRVALRFDRGLIPGILLGDSGYAQSNYLFTPVANPVTDAEVRYNAAHASTRNTIERLFGVWKRRFPCLSRKLNNHILNSANIILACAVLHNICILTKDEAFTSRPNDNVEVGNAPAHAIDNNQNARAIKAAFIIRHFS